MTIIGELISGPLNDWICLYLTRKNRGVYEPEFRLPLMFVAVILGVVGFYGFGITLHYKTHWLGPVLCFGFANMSLVFAATCVFGYIVDSYKEHNEEAFVAINARNLLTFGLTYFVVDWYQAQGPLIVFTILGSLFLGVSLLTIPLWYVSPLCFVSAFSLGIGKRRRHMYCPLTTSNRIFGKRFRAYTGSNEFLVRFMNDNE